MNIIKTAVQRPVGVIMLIICLLLIGSVTLRDIPIDLYPEIENPTVTVSASYEDVAPQDMEKMVTQPIERQIASLKGVESMLSTTGSGSVRIRVTFSDSVDFEKSVTELQEQMSRVSRSLPDGVGTPTVSQFDINSMPVMTLALVGKDTVSLQQLATDLTPDFERIEGVAGISVEGGRSADLQITLNPLLLRQYGLTANDVVNAIRSKDTSNTVGSVPKGDEEVQIRVDGEYRSLSEIGETTLQLNEGHTITINDLAEISNSTDEVESITRINQEEGVLLSISKQSGSNTVQIADQIYETMNSIQGELEEGINLVVVNDQSTFIRSSISGVTMSMMIGGLMALFVLLFFLRSVRATLVIGLSIPIAILSTFILIRYSGQTLNVITLSGLALGIGMMVDSSIVILENIIKYKQDGKSAREAAIQGGSELISAVIASTTTTLVVFLPLVLIDNGDITKIFLPMAMVVSFALITALLVAITLVPMAASRLLNRTNGAKWADDPVWMKFLINIYDRGLKTTLRYRWTTLFAVLTLTIGSCFFITTLGVNTFPQSEEQRINISARFDEGTAFAEIEEYANQAGEVLGKYEEEVELNQTRITSTGISIALQLADESERSLSTAQLSAAIQQELKQIVGVNFTLGRAWRSAGGGGSDLQINLAGPDQEVLNALIEQVELLLSRIPEVENVEVPSVNGQPQFTIRINEQLAAKYGLSQGQVMDQLSVVFRGTSASNYQEDGIEYNILVQYPESESDSIADLDGFMLETSAGQQISLGTISAIQETTGPVSIQRENQRQMYTVEADITNNAEAVQVNRTVNQLISLIPLPNGYEVTAGGVRQEFDDALGDLLLTIGLAIFLVYMVMAVQFESFIYPFIVMFSLPTSIIGVVAGLLLTGLPLSFPAFIGMIVLAGIVVNNAIILVDYINQLKARGIERNEAILQAGRNRLRPILMTTATTVLGMLPLALALSEGSEMQQPIGVVTIFGLSISMLFTLFFVPVMYSLIDDGGKKFYHWINKRLGGVVDKEDSSSIPVE